MHGIILKTRYRTIWISDVHLGTRGCKADYLLDFLASTESDQLYLVGDIVDGWQLKRSWYWPKAHDDILQSVLKKARRGTRVVYVPGNHDEVFRRYIGVHFAGVEVREDTVHEIADGRRLLVLHGDRFDNFVRYAKWVALLGDVSYQLAIKINTWFNRARRRLGLPYWSLSAYLKYKVKNAVQFVHDYEEAVAHEAATRGVDGVVCGHIHQAEIRTLGPVLYCNDGDWVESCTALVEHQDGRLELLHWAEIRSFDLFEAAQCA